MNTILQKRIEEAANITVQNLYDYAKQTRNPEVSKYDEGYLDAIDVQGDFLFREGANYALSNQWISVEEALPEKNVFVFVRGENTLGTFFNSDYIGCNGNWYLLSNYGTVPDRKITHWMSIPSMEGGEE